MAAARAAPRAKALNALLNAAAVGLSASRIARRGAQCREIDVNNSVLEAGRIVDMRHGILRSAPVTQFATDARQDAAARGREHEETLDLLARRA